MKVLFVVCGVLLVVLAVSGRPVCEECDEEAPLAVPDDHVLKAVKPPVARPVGSFEEAPDNVDQMNIIDAPVVCPPGQKPDHNGKCREVWGL